jgi:phage FluMu protein Com
MISRNEKQTMKPEDPGALQEVRCGCGCLVAKLLRMGIELKCRRCKRMALIPFNAFKDGEAVTVKL